jgi:hypothetical protein
MEKIMSDVMQSRHLTYNGERIDSGTRVWIDDKEHGKITDLPHVKRHSPTGFEWGYNGSGPADLALSILSYHLEMPNGVAASLYQAFKMEWIARLDEKWSIHRNQIDAWLQKRWDQMTEDQIKDDLRA